ncbi:MAG TPA: NAD(P)H-binding protein [Gemmatimonadaceae bacterium]
MQRFVFVTGGTGYIGSRVIAALLVRGHRVRALARPGSQRKLPAGCEVALGNALDAASFADQIEPADTFLQLVGVAHPGPSKAALFESIDFVSVRESVAAVAQAQIAHFIYLSVAHPVSVMRAYQDVRIRGEMMIRDAGLRATMLRPWYVLGPGHWWPIALLPYYGIAELVPSMRQSARRAGLVTITQMVRAIVAAVESGPPRDDARVLDVAAIRRSKLRQQL